jgi:hypothetical protein
MSSKQMAGNVSIAFIQLAPTMSCCCIQRQRSVVHGILNPSWLNYAPRHEYVWWSGGIAPPFSTAALVGGELFSLCPGRFAYGENAPSTHYLGGYISEKDGNHSVKTYFISFLTNPNSVIRCCNVSNISFADNPK